MEERLDTEYCKHCGDFYAINPIAWMCFGEYGGETLSSGEGLFHCPRCSTPIKRYVGYLDALKKRESTDFLNEVLSDISDLSVSSKRILRLLLANLTVPSFSVLARGDNHSLISELLRKRYVEIIKLDNLSIITVNAFKLGLLEHKQLLLEMSHQSSFIKNPEYLKGDTQAYLRRKTRTNALINDLTAEDRAEILARFNNKCALTGRDVPLHLDHVIPVAVGHGGTTKANILPVWQRINSSKSDRNIFEWYEENGERFGVCPSKFSESIEYLAGLNGMTFEEYKDYVYDCHENPNDIVAERERLHEQQ